MEYKEEIDRLAKEFESCQKILLALGDENRQHLILEMIQRCTGRHDYRKDTSFPSCCFSPHTNIERGRNFESSKGRNKKLLLF